MGGETNGIGWGSRNYHPGTVAGDQTDYGEYNVLVLEHLSSAASLPPPALFSVEALLPLWKERISGDWKQWICTQSRLTYQQVSQNVPVPQLGGTSNAMALRFAAVFAYYQEEEEVVDAARKVMFTHRERTAVMGGEFFARVTHRVVHGGLTPREAIDGVAAESDPWIQEKVELAIEKFEEATDGGSALSGEEFADDLALTSMSRLWDVGKSEPIKVGKASPTEGTLPGAVYFILKYGEDYGGAVKANAMVGGDNASRAIAIGMVLGAAHGVEAIGGDLKAGLNCWKASEAMMEGMPLLEGRGREG